MWSEEVPAVSGSAGRGGSGLEAPRPDPPSLLPVHFWVMILSRALPFTGTRRRPEQSSGSSQTVEPEGGPGEPWLAQI